jgi:hypothetical protein
MKEVAMKEISALQPVPQDRSGAAAGELSVLISGTRAEVSAYLTHARARQRRLLNVAILAGALGTASAGPLAVIGEDLSDWLTPIVGVSAWRLLCALAAACALVAAIATHLLKSQNLEERVTRAESVRTRLAILDIGRITGTLTPTQVATEYAACLELTSFT